MSWRFHKGHLNFKEPKLCEKLIADLELKYGTPIADRTFRPFSDDPPDHSVTWYDQENHNQVDVFYRRYPAVLNFNDDCELRYIPFDVSASASSPGEMTRRARQSAAPDAAENRKPKHAKGVGKRHKRRHERNA